MWPGRAKGLLCVVSGLHTERWSYAIGWCLVTWKQQNKLVEWKALILWGLRVTIWKINFCSRVLRISVLPWCRERPQTAICCLLDLSLFVLVLKSPDGEWPIKYTYKRIGKQGYVFILTDFKKWCSDVSFLTSSVNGYFETGKRWIF